MVSNQDGPQMLSDNWSSLSLIFSVPLHCLDVTPVSQVRGGHSVQWPVGAGEPPRERGLQADGRGGHEHIYQLEQGWLEVRKIQLKLTVTVQWSNDFDCISGFFWGEQGAEDFGHRDGDVHRHVLSLPADQDHEECPLAVRQVRTENTEIFTQHPLIWQHHCSCRVLLLQYLINPAVQTIYHICRQSRKRLELCQFEGCIQSQILTDLARIKDTCQTY